MYWHHFMWTSQTKDTHILYRIITIQLSKCIQNGERGQTSSHRAFPEPLQAENTTLTCYPCFLTGPWCLLHRDWALIWHFLCSGLGMPRQLKHNSITKVNKVKQKTKMLQIKDNNKLKYWPSWLVAPRKPLSPKTRPHISLSYYH